jgi:hypothetical protein
VLREARVDKDASRWVAVLGAAGAADADAARALGGLCQVLTAAAHNGARAADKLRDTEAAHAAERTDIKRQLRRMMQGVRQKLEADRRSAAVLEECEAFLVDAERQFHHYQDDRITLAQRILQMRQLVQRKLAQDRMAEEEFRASFVGGGGDDGASMAFVYPPPASGDAAARPGGIGDIGINGHTESHNGSADYFYPPPDGTAAPRTAAPAPFLMPSTGATGYEDYNRASAAGAGVADHPPSRQSSLYDGNRSMSYRPPSPPPQRYQPTGQQQYHDVSDSRGSLPPYYTNY